MSGPAVPNPRLVLLVDSDGPTRGEVIRLIRKLGYDGRAVARGRDAVTAVREAPLAYGIVLAELLNRGMDGGEVAERLREVRPGLPVVLRARVFHQAACAVRAGAPPPPHPRPADVSAIAGRSAFGTELGAAEHAVAAEPAHGSRVPIRRLA